MNKLFLMLLSLLLSGFLVGCGGENSITNSPVVIEEEPDSEGVSVEDTIDDGEEGDEGSKTYNKDKDIDSKPPTFLRIDNVSADESAGTFTFTVSLSVFSEQDVSVDFTSIDGTALAKWDYIPVIGTLTIPAGDTSGNIIVSIMDDVISEDDETFTISLSAPVNALISIGQGLGTINDNEGTPSLTIADVSVREGNSGTTYATFPVTLVPESSQTITVNYSTVDGSATAPDDYIAVSLSTLTFAPGITTLMMTVPVLGDLINEPDETYLVILSNPVNAIISDNQARGTIVNDDSGAAIQTFLNTPFTGDFTIPFDFYINLVAGSYTLKVTGLYGVAFNRIAMDAAYEWYGERRKHGMWSFNGDDGRYGSGIRPTPDIYNDTHVYYYHFVITEQQTITIANQDNRFDDNSGALIYEFLGDGG